jgi:hypothetical protein
MRPAEATRKSEQQSEDTAEDKTERAKTAEDKTEHDKTAHDKTEPTTMTVSASMMECAALDGLLYRCSGVLEFDPGSGGFSFLPRGAWTKQTHGPR